MKLDVVFKHPQIIFFSVRSNVSKEITAVLLTALNELGACTLFMN